MSRPITAILHADSMRRDLAVVRPHAPASPVMAMVRAECCGDGCARLAPAFTPVPV
ncbi:hypothetical protein [Luteimonas mephitis]|jgi:alanine racemase|uniref:hypothetical protein n=1 Tax=Luteimonas mephitis TaxID=83615 RepID=UPI00041CDEAF|nr:hypothetical protein [Luteimonas mephitis]